MTKSDASIEVEVNESIAKQLVIYKNISKKLLKVNCDLCDITDRSHNLNITIKQFIRDNVEDYENFHLYKALEEIIDLNFKALKSYKDDIFEFKESIK